MMIQWEPNLYSRINNFDHKPKRIKFSYVKTGKIIFCAANIYLQVKLKICTFDMQNSNCSYLHNKMVNILKTGVYQESLAQSGWKVADTWNNFSHVGLTDHLYLLPTSTSQCILATWTVGIRNTRGTVCSTTRDGQDLP